MYEALAHGKNLVVHLADHAVTAHGDRQEFLEISTNDQHTTARHVEVRGHGPLVAIRDVSSHPTKHSDVAAVPLHKLTGRTQMNITEALLVHCHRKKTDCRTNVNE